MTRMLRVLLCLVAVVCLMGGFAQAKDIEKVRIGTEGAYPPFNYVDSNGDLQGFDIDIAKALCDAMDVECEFVMQEWSGMIPGLLAKKYDAIIASMSITEEREKKVDFTEKYYQTPAKFVARKGTIEDINKDTLQGKVVGVQRATIHENFVRDKFGDLVEVRSYETLEEANMDLISGRLDLICADSVPLQESLLDKDFGKDFHFVGPGYVDEKWFGEGIGIAVRKEDDKLRKMFNKAIQKIRENGTYQKINAKYFDFDVYGD